MNRRQLSRYLECKQAKFSRTAKKIPALKIKEAEMDMTEDNLNQLQEKEVSIKLASKLKWDVKFITLKLTIWSYTM